LGGLEEKNHILYTLICLNCGAKVIKILNKKEEIRII
jgi:DNA-directed RNA polymerase subunit RPC12/RpoP